MRDFSGVLMVTVARAENAVGFRYRTSRSGNQCKSDSPRISAFNKRDPVPVSSRSSSGQVPGSIAVGLRACAGPRTPGLCGRRHLRMIGRTRIQGPPATPPGYYPATCRSLLKCLPIAWPPATPSIQAPMEADTRMAVRRHSPRSMLSSTSAVNTEKVVNPPHIPAITNRRCAGDAASRPPGSVKAAYTPITTDPITLTARVLQGMPT